jgi:hypothetical protein
MNGNISVIYALVVDLALKRGHRDIKGQVVELEYSDIWKATINGSSDHTQGISIPPYHVFIQCNGWPVTIVGPSGGAPILGASEDEIIAALNKAGAALKRKQWTADGG